MSSVTDVILTCSVLEESDGYRAIEYINVVLHPHKLKHLNGNEGGGKAWQIEVFGGAFNYLDIEEFSRAIKTAPWCFPEAVVLLIQGEHEDRMEMVQLEPRTDTRTLLCDHMQRVFDK